MNKMCAKRLAWLAVAGVVMLPAYATASAKETDAATRAAAAALKRDSSNCKAHANIDACYDAIRWNPNNPALLIALGDALTQANRGADALRNYRRAAEIAPNTRGLAAKISATEARLANNHRRAGSHEHSASSADPHYSNTEPQSQSH